MIYDLLVVLLAAAGVVFLIRLMLGMLLMPVRGKGCRVCVTLSVEGEAPDLERVFRGARWLAREGAVELVLIDNGVTQSARQAAERLVYGEDCPLYSAQEIREDLSKIL